MPWSLNQRPARTRVNRLPLNRPEGRAKERWDGFDGIYGGAFQGTVFILTHRPPDGEDGRFELERLFLGEADRLTDLRFRFVKQS